MSLTSQASRAAVFFLSIPGDSCGIRLVYAQAPLHWPQLVLGASIALSQDLGVVGGGKIAYAKLKSTMTNRIERPTHDCGYML